jgi:uncharacterized membrane protein YdjX (TVP38/TMEM64 family)
MTTKTKSRGCASGWGYLPIAGLLIFAAGVGFFGATLPASLTWIAVVAGAVCAQLARRAIERAIKAAHVCGYKAGVDDVLRQLAASGVQVTHITPEGVERL